MDLAIRSLDYHSYSKVQTVQTGKVQTAEPRDRYKPGIMWHKPGNNTEPNKDKK
ncbi:hypothetical protein SERLA73DRAFT_80484 [Serpula lacrymans var. lacrymans S7.3]|uniref:Uncharacterized protein n=1 Tax=Serpula lacrymans var. lacrymans (strain S7.3) TaxID=936435 RepID=F8QJT7_SERL3|nr:hypothetical protein SERLA73DRAFT_80484 [Serpula lacrymans var. lacrymans S7.3]